MRLERRVAATNASTCWRRSEEHTSELQSQSNLVCRLLLEKKKIIGRLVSHTSSLNSSYYSALLQQHYAVHSRLSYPTPHLDCPYLHDATYVYCHASG